MKIFHEASACRKGKKKSSQLRTKLIFLNWCFFFLTLQLRHCCKWSYKVQRRKCSDGAANVYSSHLSLTLHLFEVSNHKCVLVGVCMCVSCAPPSPLRRYCAMILKRQQMVLCYTTLEWHEYAHKHSVKHKKTHLVECITSEYRLWSQVLSEKWINKEIRPSWSK